MSTVSVIIPTYNRAHTLARALDSVLAQSLPPAEILVIDDGSTDDTTSLLQKYGKAITPLYQAHQGVSRARNVGIHAATSEWLAFLDSDDAWHPHKLATQCAALNTQRALLCHTNEIWYRHGKQVNPKKHHQKCGGDIFTRCLALCLISPSSVMLHRDLLNKVGLFDENLPACEDYDLWLRITAHYSVLYLDEPLTLKYGGHADQLSQQHWGMDRFRIKALQKIIASNTLPADKLAAAQAMLEKKMRIFNQGAKKRSRKTL